MEQSITVDVAATPERVWEVLSDVEYWSDWTPTVTMVRRLDEGPLRTGSRARISQPRIPETEYVVTELEPGRSFTWVATGPGVLTTARHDVEPLLVFVMFICIPVNVDQTSETGVKCVTRANNLFGTS